MLVTGASGGVGTALIELGKVLRLHVIAIASASKLSRVRELGADVTIDRGAPDLRAALREADVGAVDGIVDVVGGDELSRLLDVVADGGTCVTAGAIGGELAPIDLRHLIYKDLDLRGVSCPRISTFAMLVDLINAAELHPAIAATYPLHEFVSAQRAFVEKRHVGNIVVTVSTN